MSYEQFSYEIQKVKGLVDHQIFCQISLYFHVCNNSIVVVLVSI